ncbi:MULTISPECIES: TrmH family RNA methyltransferase [unclassified Sedimentibacter]|uniref:TrmH family RNA methyltransferase n=1 Tax=unclassified Sedimentibacter TaxID=2649220 RepID=UPI0027DFA4B2|nr:TrmH family RNA methyltransferase [Sedimentibacter sp. MB35-C1]WMJ78289.1 TrmH family RNA methyltransferase [Sedimentibacter sp. MB35-C1]
MDIKAYKKGFEHSYTFGMFPTVELIKFRPEAVVKVLVSSNYKSESDADIFEICRRYGVKTEVADKAIRRISDKENNFVVGVFSKYQCRLNAEASHLVLVNPGNMGNMGTIIRTLTGFGLSNLAVISPGVDIFDPKVVRASMGSLFRINFKYFDSFDEYKDAYNNRRIYTFMLDGAKTLKDVRHDENELFSLVFGNESTGLDSSFSSAGTSVFIKHTDRIDSLNLTIAAGIAMYHFCS